ncbi:MAG TPA: MBL fold metallo-hydrolase [Mycobacteriales bacterium]|jgi:ribonuclease BN (tRNA processing enzyme)|nr:MBL fold metallo-hydrolase [Mycobacteriales bacterium]
MKVTVVGMSGTFPGPHSGCSSYLVEHDGFRLLLDIGNGSTGALQDVCGLLELDAVAISHLHGDHFLDLITYTYARRYHPAGNPPPLPVYGPSTIYEGIVGAYARDVHELLAEVYEFNPVAENGVRQIGPFEVSFHLVNHPVETYAMRVSAGGRTVAYSADTGECEELVGLARDVDLFLCEASYLDGEPNPPGVHLTGLQAGEYAMRAGAKRLMLTHLVPWGDPARTLAEAQRSYDGEVLVARPLDSYDV